jgi:outer membrane protein assembly factor BamB
MSCPTRSLAATLLAVLTSLPILAGCAERTRSSAAVAVPANGFVKNWGADLGLKRDAAERIFVRDDLVFLYTESNRAYVLSTAGGQLLSANTITARGGEIRPPVLLGDKVVYPALATVEVYDRRGRLISSIPLDRPTRSPAAPGPGNVMYFGVDYHNGGRLLKYDITRTFGKVLWELMTFAPISASPAVYEDAVYAASEDGRTYAVAANRDPIWPIEGNTFMTAGRVVADLKVDDFGLYVASMDSKLYCLDRQTGRIKWTYFAGSPLREPPVVLPDRVYQYVPGRGIVSIDKTEGKPMREVVWAAPGARRFLSADDANVYVLASDNSIVALDKATGEPKFRSRRRDLTITTPNTKDATIFAATKRGEVLSIRPVLKGGSVGQVVFDERVLSEPLAQTGRD